MTASWLWEAMRATSRMLPDSRLGLIWCDSRMIGRAVNTAATAHTAELVRIPEAIGIARKMTDQITPNCGGGGGVPLTKANSTPATPISRPDRPKMTTFCTQRRTPTASAPSGW
jgi:hypothetical protein